MDFISVELATLMIVSDSAKVSKQWPYRFHLSNEMQFLIAPSSICPIALTTVPLFGLFPFNCIHCRNGLGFSTSSFNSVICRIRSDVGALYMRTGDLFVS